MSNRRIKPGVLMGCGMLVSAAVLVVLTFRDNSTTPDFQSSNRRIMSRTQSLAPTQTKSSRDLFPAAMDPPAKINHYAAAGDIVGLQTGGQQMVRRRSGGSPGLA